MSSGDLFVGLMSGTSIDGIDEAEVDALIRAAGGIPSPRSADGGGGARGEEREAAADERRTYNHKSWE